MKSLLLGCGNNRLKKVALPDDREWRGQLVTADMNPNCGADLVMDIGKLPLPFADEEFDEIGAYDVLEHVGAQGDWRRWFDECAEYWRILKPGGRMGILVPIGNEAYADPGHTRVFNANYFYALNQKWYAERLAENAPVTDYRWFYKKNFEILAVAEVDGHHLAAVLQKS
jgi:SAM-dependent methyltransferase